MVSGLTNEALTAHLKAAWELGRTKSLSQLKQAFYPEMRRFIYGDDEKPPYYMGPLIATPITGPLDNISNLHILLGVMSHEASPAFDADLLVGANKHSTVTVRPATPTPVMTDAGGGKMRGVLVPVYHSMTVRGGPKKDDGDAALYALGVMLDRDTAAHIHKNIIVDVPGRFCCAHGLYFPTADPELLEAHVARVRRDFYQTGDFSGRYGDVPPPLPEVLSRSMGDSSNVWDIGFAL